MNTVTRTIQGARNRLSRTKETNLLYVIVNWRTTLIVCLKGHRSADTVIHMSVFLLTMGHLVLNDLCLDPSLPH